MPYEMKAIAHWIGQEGRVQKGQRITVKDEKRRDELVKSKRAVMVSDTGQGDESGSGDSSESGKKRQTKATGPGSKKGQKSTGSE